MYRVHHEPKTILSSLFSHYPNSSDVRIPLPLNKPSALYVYILFPVAMIKNLLRVQLVFCLETLHLMFR